MSTEPFIKHLITLSHIMLSVQTCRAVIILKNHLIVYEFYMTLKNCSTNLNTVDVLSPRLLVSKLQTHIHISNSLTQHVFDQMMTPIRRTLKTKNSAVDVDNHVMFTSGMWHY